jgi:hypothetical protein
VTKVATQGSGLAFVIFLLTSAIFWSDTLPNAHGYQPSLPWPPPADPSVRGDVHDEGTDAVTRIRKLGALTLATSIITGVVLIGAPSPASADINSPADGRVFTSGSTVSVTATGAAWGQLSVRTPEGNDIPGGQAGFLATPLHVDVPIDVNGTYTVTLTGWGAGTRTFIVRKPPQAPSGLSATASGSKVIVSWNQGTETDLTGYSVSVGGASKNGTVGSFCSGSACTTNMNTSATGPINVAVTAHRRGGTSATSSTTVSRTPGGGGAGQVPNLPSGSGASNIPLTSADPSSPYNLPNVAPEGSNPNFAYPTPPPQVAQQLSPRKGALAAESPEMQWGKSIAIALILLVCAAHLGTWTRRLRLAQAGDAPRASRLGRARVSVAQARIAQAEALAKAGALGKEAVLGQEGTEEKTNKRRKDKGTDFAEAPELEAAEETSFEDAADEHEETLEATGSVEEALAALTRGSETSIYLGPLEELDEEDDFYTLPVKSPDAHNEPGGYDSANSSHAKPARRSLLGRGTRGRRRAK